MTGHGKILPIGVRGHLPTPAHQPWVQRQKPVTTAHRARIPVQHDHVSAALHHCRVGNRPNVPRSQTFARRRAESPGDEIGAGLRLRGRLLHGSFLPASRHAAIATSTP